MTKPARRACLYPKHSWGHQVLAGCACLDVQDKNHMLFGGTKILQHTPDKEARIRSGLHRQQEAHGACHATEWAMKQQHIRLW
jgi:hypothetical protein